jgi:CheY-like chemotaxis protein
MAPVIMVTATATAGAIIAARDAGVHEFLRKPYNTKELLRRLEAVTLHPRDWVEAVQYVGPDRRRFNSGDYSGPLKRRSDVAVTPDAERILQALKIVRSAIPAIATDPTQAMRALLAQMIELQRGAAVTKDAKLARLATDFQLYLATIAQAKTFNPTEMADRAQGLLALLPKDDPGRDQAA